MVGVVDGEAVDLAKEIRECGWLEGCGIEIASYEDL